MMKCVQCVLVKILTIYIIWDINLVTDIGIKWLIKNNIKNNIKRNYQETSKKINKNEWSPWIRWDISNYK